MVLSGLTGTAQSFSSPGRTAIYPIQACTCLLTTQAILLTSCPMPPSCCVDTLAVEHAHSVSILQPMVLRCRSTLFCCVRIPNDRKTLWLPQGFANGTAGAQFVDTAGNWMGNPTAVLRGVANDNATALLVSLSAPKFSAGASSVSTTNNNVAPSASVFISNTNSAPAQVPASFSPCC